MEQIMALILGGVASWVQGSKGKSLGKRWKYVISFGACVVAALAVEGIKLAAGGEFDPHMTLQYLGIAFASSQTLYNTYFRLK